ncbi:MAG: transposase [Endozoicomonas sp.]|uniref:transposase n=1 Tax=Endozoicomonas sp. TaxID=1892382 RepID=UPI003D9BB131
MPRQARIHLVGIPQHIVQKGHNRLPCFFDDEDYEFYLKSLRVASDQYQVQVHAYVLLPNAIQIIATPRIDKGISSMMQSLGRRYVQYINHRYKRSGTLWEGRFKSSLIDSENFLLTCYRYLELRPLHLGLVDELGEYRWSSYQHHCGNEICNLIQDHRLYLQLGENREERCNAYSESFRYRFDRRLLNYVAETVNMGQVLGGDAFKEKIEQIADHRIRPLKRGRPRKKKAELEEESS